MFGGVPDFEFGGPVGGGATDSDTKRVIIVKNGVGSSGSEPISIKLSSRSRLQELLATAGQKLKMEAPARAFLSSGEEIFDLDAVLDDEVVHISAGEGFARGGAGEEQVIGGYMVQKKLGEGGFGKVMKALHLETGRTVAMKFISKRQFREISDVDRVFIEIQALRDLSHKNVIEMLDVIDHPAYICFVLEFAPNGELREYVAEREFLDEDEARKFFLQIVKAVHYCHSKNVVHRDLKLENILLDEEFKCKIADFGLSDFVAESERTKTEGGTEAYLAPEVWKGNSSDFSPYKLDVWALGVILFAMTHGVLPFNTPDKVTCDKIERGGIEFRDGISTALQNAITLLLTVDPIKRPHVNDILADPWVRQQSLGATTPRVCTVDLSNPSLACVSANTDVPTGSPSSQRDHVNLPTGAGMLHTFPANHARAVSRPISRAAGYDSEGVGTPTPRNRPVSFPAERKADRETTSPTIAPAAAGPAPVAPPTRHTKFADSGRDILSTSGKHQERDGNGRSPEASNAAPHPQRRSESRQYTLNDEVLAGELHPHHQGVGVAEGPRTRRTDSTHSGGPVTRERSTGAERDDHRRKTPLTSSGHGVLGATAAAAREAGAKSGAMTARGGRESVVGRDREPLPSARGRDASRLAQVGASVMAMSGGGGGTTARRRQ
uniref:Protein kinase domain-containing protein n=1 Tax=Chromera velia CCMP2878 TaxID=1169474 RepID=A0A0G4GAP9_9ALVE|eukprot:Cvel_4439.t1-p1 / transcript=Cvel_4439.t1 / gene=Cvel_4439 / organism=Chromera_velia_CCMP2878 / gene_product=Carbon catabolite-derepressing protein kinase, putative / transcript_product=Carbon catabolite-derepressing protein kinase, putative / location=Cvel_scaffold193:69113-75480(-) / protein_length=664 / sequence_SO=supercontig / SO=protein_coding / is_pseudo=false